MCMGREIEKRRCTTADEMDVHGNYRRYYTSYKRAGATARIKRETRRRERREGKRALGTA